MTTVVLSPLRKQGDVNKGPSSPDSCAFTGLKRSSDGHDTAYTGLWHLSDNHVGMYTGLRHLSAGHVSA